MVVLNIMQVNHPTVEQLNAVIRFATEHGRTWKSQLNDAWMTGNYVGFVGSHLLQQVRNQFGPEWLVKFNLKKALAAQAQAQEPLEQLTGPVEPCPVEEGRYAQILGVTVDVKAHEEKRRATLKADPANCETYTDRGHKIEIVWSGAVDWYDYYVDGKPWGCAKARDIKKRIEQVIDLKEAAYQPKIILDAIDNALGK
jgi:hypothetical protein